MDTNQARVGDWSTHPWVADAQATIRFGVGVSTGAGAHDWSHHLALVQEFEALGFDSHWLPDHPAYLFDCWGLLTALAVSTTRIRIGPLVSCVGYRSPIQLARHAADVDRLSGGRLILGLGNGWVASEFAQLGLPFPPARERAWMLAEAVEIIHGVWGTTSGAAAPAGETTADPLTGLPTLPPFAYHGEHYRLDGAVVRTPPVQRPRVPVMIAGGGERVTLRQVVRYADAANFGADGTPGAVEAADGVRRKLAVLRQHCAELGRPYDSVLPTHFTNPMVLAETETALATKRNQLPAGYRERRQGLYGTPEDAIAYYRPLVEAGLRYFIVNLATYEDGETARLLAREVLPALMS
jgi:alkanesulfonate monooxygenase SsuD/methylene tetrahydromethanopterin reductase-like flavin-dependent oxidoreductase (luciferase family)